MKIHEYREMMSYLTRPAQSTTRENFAESIEPKIKKYKQLVKAGTSTTDAKNKVIKLFKLKRSKSAGTPVWAQKGKEQLIQEGVLEDIERGTIKTIGETEDLSKNKDIKKLSTETVEPSIKKVTYENKATGKKFVRYKPLMRSNTVTVSGAGFDTIEKARKTVEDYNKANPKKMAVTLKLEEDLKKLSDSPRLEPLLKTGTPDKKYLKVVQDILGINVSQAEDKLKQLGEAVKPGSNFDVPGINKISEKKAKNISDFYKSKSVSKTVVDKEIGKSVGERSLKNLRGEVQKELPFSGGPETFETDEAKAKMGSFRLGSKPYSIFGQVIDGRLNQGDKMRVDAQLSRLEEDVQKALRGELIRDGKKISPQQAVTIYNAAATQAEKEFNSQKMRQFKAVRIPKISLKSPNETIANKAAYKKYKQYFDKNFKELGYSFQIPKDLRPIPEIAADLKDKSSPAYKTMIKNVKEIGKKFIKNIDEYDEKELLKIFENPKFQQFKKFIPRLTSVDDFSERRYVSANNIMTDATYIDDEGEQTFAERNPLTTGAALTAPSAVAVQRAAGIPILEALKNLGKVPFKTFMSVPGAGYFAYDTIKEGMDEGKSFVDAATEPEVGLELLYPEVLKRTGATFLNPLTRASTPIGIGITTIGTLKNRAQEMMRQAEGITALPAGEAQNRLIEEYAAKNYRGYANGGRIGFADGPEDPSKRKFMKIMGGLASLPILGRFIKVGEQAPVVLEAAKGMPEWFGTLVDKVIKTGVDATKRFATKDREQVYEKFLGEEEGVRVYKDLEKGDIKVEYFSPDNMGGTTSSVDMIYKAPEQLENGVTVPSEFKAVEAEPRGVRSGPDDYDIEFDGENVVESIEDLNSDLGRLEFYATDKMPDLKKIEKSNEKRKRVQAINDDISEQAEYLETKYGPGDTDYYD